MYIMYTYICVFIFTYNSIQDRIFVSVNETKNNLSNVNGKNNI